MSSNERYELAIQHRSLNSRPDSVDTFLKELLSGTKIAKGHSKGLRLLLHTSTDPVSGRHLRRVFRNRRRELRSEGIAYFDQKRLKKVVGYRSWASQSGPSLKIETAFRAALASEVDEALRLVTARMGSRTPTLIVSSDVFFSHQLRKGDGISAPLPTSMRTIRSTINALSPVQVDVAIHRFVPGLSFAGMYQLYVEAGGTSDPGPAARLWLGRGDLDVETWQAHLKKVVGLPDIRVLDCNSANYLAEGVALLESLDIRLRQSMLPLDAQLRSLGRRRLSIKGSQILARINRSDPSQLQLKKSEQWVNFEFSGSAEAVGAEAAKLLAKL